MKPIDTTTLGRFLAATALLALVARPAAAQSGPDFDTVSWIPASCSAGDPAGDEHPASVDLVGDATYPASYAAHDANFLYFRYRVDGNPSGPGGFDSYSWNVLVQVPSGDPFQYQYELSLFGVADAVQIWANTQASDISFSPLFHDDAETQLFSQGYATTTAMNSAPLARTLAATDGSAFGGNGDYFVDFAFPVGALVNAGMIASAADLDQTFFFPATSTNPNNYNKGHLDCAFTPSTALAVDASVTPATVPANTATPVAYSIAVQNAGSALARGVVVEEPALPGFVSAPVVTVSSDDPSVTWTVVSTTPLEVRVPNLPIGKTVTVQLAATATPGCGTGDATTVATSFATNAMDVSDDAVLSTNGIAGGCAACTTDVDCDDANACTTDACVAGSCTATPAADCTPCAANVQCDDADACTTDTCAAGVCTTSPIADCAPCTVDADCDDTNACTTDSCVAGACTASPIAGCVTCAADTDCDDSDACTSDSCAGGACAHAAIPGCGTNPPVVESCHNGVDDDGNGAVDCADPACAADPGCKAGKVEICGDCIDNDGDGLVDYDDPDCCTDTSALDVRKLRLRPIAKNPNGRRLAMTARYASLPADFDPMKGATLQLSDPSGTLFCETMPASAWKHPNAHVFRYRDKTGTLAGGLKRSRFKMKKQGGAVFRTMGKKVALGQTDGHDVKVTVAVGGRCAQSMTQLRARGATMIFP